MEASGLKMSRHTEGHVVANISTRHDGEDTGPRGGGGFMWRPGVWRKCLAVLSIT